MSKRRLAWLTPDEIPAGTTCRVLIIPDNDDFRALVNGALYNLTDAVNFEQFGALTPDETAERFAIMVDTYLEDACVEAQVLDLIIIEDQKTSTTDGGTFTSGAWRTRDLNTEVIDTAGICTLSANQFSIAAGTYDYDITTMAFNVGRHVARLYNVTDSTEVRVSTAGYAGGNNSNVHIKGRMVIAATKTFRIEHQTLSGSQVTNGFGVGNNNAGNVYTRVRLERIAL